MLSCPCVSDHGLKNWWRGGLWVCNKHVTFLMKNVLLLGLLQVVQHWLLKIEDQKFLKVSTLCRLGPFWLIRAKELRAGSLCPSLSQPWGGRSHLIWMPRSPGPDQMAEGKRHRSDMKRLQGCCWWGKKRKQAFLFYYFNPHDSEKCLSVSLQRLGVCDQSVKNTPWSLFNEIHAECGTALKIKIKGNSHPKLMIILNWFVTSGLSQEQYILIPFKNNSSGYQSKNFLILSLMSVKSIKFCLFWILWTNALLFAFYIYPDVSSV